MLDPIARIAEELRKIDGDAVSRDPDVALGRAISPGPAPDLAEHPLVQAEQEAFVQNLAPPVEHPTVGSEHALLLGLVEFVAKRDVGGDQAFALGRRQRRRRVVVFR